MKKKCLFLFVLLCSCFLSAEEPAPLSADQVYADTLIFMQVMELVREKYVDENKVGYKELIRSAMCGMLQSLDPFSIYESPESFKETIEDTQGAFAGIGVRLRQENGKTQIFHLTKEAPAEAAGLKVGDELLAVDDDSVEGMKLDSVSEKIRGTPDTKLKIKVMRPSENKEYEFEIIRKIIPVQTVVNNGILYGKTAYLRITQFSEATPEQFSKVLNSKEVAESDGLIIDLRFNPGGVLESVLTVLSSFVPTGELLLSVEGRAYEKKIHKSMDVPKFKKLPMVILVNGASASAAEIFAGCMKDYKLGVLIGTKTFGKGSVQTLMPLPDGGGLRLTVAKYYTPHRLEIHQKGIEPDISVPISEDKVQALADFFYKDEDSLPNPENDIQLQRAVEIMKGIQAFQAPEK